MDLYLTLESIKLTASERKIYDSACAKMETARAALAEYRPMHPNGLDFSAPRERIGTLSDQFLVNPSSEILAELVRLATVDSVLNYVNKSYLAGLEESLSNEAAATLAPIVSAVIDRALAAIDAEAESVIAKLKEIPHMADAIASIEAKRQRATEAAAEEKLAAQADWRWLGNYLEAV